MDNKKFFTVARRVIKGSLYEGTADRSGYAEELEEQVGGVEYLIGFKVYEYDEQGMETGGRLYRIDRDHIGGDPDSVLDKIEADHPATEWECFEW